MPGRGIPAEPLFRSRVGRGQVALLGRVQHTHAIGGHCPVFFCLEIDKAVVHGFNEDLVLDVNGTLSNGAEYCDMTFKEADFRLKKMAGVAWKKIVRPGRTAVMPWEYHVGHLYKTLGEVVAQELGDEAPGVMAAALEKFTDEFGEAAGDSVLAYQDTDFDRLP